MTNGPDADRPTKLARLEPLPPASVDVESTTMPINDNRRLRSSCDACGAAKTKCDRTQPQCGRCLSMHLVCTYGPSKQLGKRPRRGLDLSSSLPQRNEPSTQANSTYASPAIERITTRSNGSNGTFDPILDMSITPPHDIQLQLPSTPSIVWPPSDFEMWGDQHRCYHLANEIIQLLSIPERLFADDGPIILDVSQILQANKRAVEALNRLVDCICAKTRGHQAMLYASLISRVLWWYREAAGDAVFRAPEAMGAPSPNSFSESSTPPSQEYTGTNRCIRIKSSAVTVGGFDIDDPHMLRGFQHQLIRHEVSKVGKLVEKYGALASDPHVQESDKILFSALGTWLKADLAKAVESIARASN